MPASVDIDYPLPGDVVGPTFAAGGDYDATGLREKKERFGDDDKIICTLYTSSDVPIGTPQVFKLREMGVDKPIQGGWNVTFIVEMPPKTDCKIRATLRVGVEPIGGYPADLIEDVDVQPEALGGGISFP